MTTPRPYDLPDPKLDLVLERVVDVPPALVWKAWTSPEHIKQWFCPRPWQTVECEIDLRPGGMFRTVMRSPEGEDHANVGCYLEIIENKRLVWTDALAPGFRPVGNNRLGFRFTGIITIEPHKGGTKYTARAMHTDEAAAKSHADMGFYQGWGTCLDQLVELMTKP